MADTGARVRGEEIIRVVVGFWIPSLRAQVQKSLILSLESLLLAIQQAISQLNQLSANPHPDSNLRSISKFRIHPALQIPPKCTSDIL